MNSPHLVLLSLFLMLLLACLAGCVPATSAPSTSGPGNTSTRPPSTADASSSVSWTAIRSTRDLPAIDGSADRFHFVEHALVDVVYRNGEEAKQRSIVESLGGGVAVFDFDSDGRLDLAFSGGGEFVGKSHLGGRPLALMRGDGKWNWWHVELEAGLKSSELYSHGVSAVDYNEDGFSDLLITGYGQVQLWRNQGDGTFVENAVAAGLNDQSWSSSAAWGDFNGDNSLDVYIAHYVNWSFENNPYCPGPTPAEQEICSPRDFQALPDAIFFSSGDGRFENATRVAGLRADGKGLGVLAGDFDDDGDMDIYVANDTTDNFLYINGGHGEFIEGGLIRGAAVDDGGMANGSMGVELLDFNRDGRLDLCVANYERELFALYRNEGQGSFLHVSRRTGLSSLGDLFVGFGLVAGDLDRDGDEDLAVANGHVILFPSAAPRRQVPLLLENHGSRFQKAPFPLSSFFSRPQEGRGLAVADLDEDGDLDLVFTRLNDSTVALENRTESAGDWVGVRLIGRQSNRVAIGAQVCLRLSNGPLVRQIRGGASYLSTSDPRAFWGLPPGADMERLEIRWPSQITQTIERPEKNGLLNIVEPQKNE